MFKSIFVTGIASLFLLSGPVQPAQPTSLDLEPTINRAVSANGLFPSQAMEEAFAAYLRWTKDRGISRLAVFEPLIDAAAVEASLPNERMATQFEAYMRWVDEQGLSPFYAFLVTDFD